MKGNKETGLILVRDTKFDKIRKWDQWKGATEEEKQDIDRGDF